MHCVCSQEAEAILENVRPSPGQLLGYGTVSVKLLVWHLCDFSYIIIFHIGWILCMLIPKLVLYGSCHFITWYEEYLHRVENKFLVENHILRIVK